MLLLIAFSPTIRLAWSQTVPAAPTGVTVTISDSTSAATLNWVAVSGATSYKVYRSTTSGSYNTTPIATTTSTTRSYTNTGLTGNTIYYYVVKASNSAGDSANSAQVTAAMPIPPPQNLAATRGSTKVTLSWTASSGATSYTVKRSTQSGTGYTTIATGVTGTTYLATGLTNGTTYWFVVVAVNGSSSSSSASGVSVKPIAPPTAPTVTATPGNAQVTLSWPLVNGDWDYEEYRIFRSTTSGTFGATPLAAVNSSEWTDTAVSNGTTYYYTVKLVGDEFTSPSSTQVSAKPLAPPATPTGFTAKGGNKQITLSWSAAPATAGVTAYQLSRTPVSGGSPATTFSLGNVTSYTDTGLLNSYSYKYSLVATNVGGDSTPALATALAANVPSAPPLSCTGGDTVITLSWGGAALSNSYQIFRSTTNGAFDAVPTYTVSASFISYKDTGLTNGTTYYYVVKAANDTGASVASNQVSARPVPPPTVPTQVVATAGSGLVRVSWQAVDSATSYAVQRATTPGGPYTSLTTGTSSTSYTNAGLTNGTTYYYIVRASNGSGTSAFSGEVSATPLATPLGLTASASNARINLSWSASAGASSYSLRRSLSSTGTFVSIATVGTGTTYSDTNVTNGTTYFYRVVAASATGQSAESSTISATPIAPPDVPVLQATAGTNQVSTTWNPVAGAASYSLGRSLTPGGPYATIALDGLLTSYIDSNVSNGTTYYYVLTASNGSGSTTSTEISVTPSPVIDARISRVVGSGWIGTNIVNTTGQEQEITQQTEAGMTATYFVSVRRINGDSGRLVHFTVPGFDAFENAGGSARFFVGTTSQDITDTITASGGWATGIAPDQEVLVRVEVAVSLNAPVGSNQSLLIQALDEDTSETPPVDAVRASTLVTPFAGNPDALIRITPSDGPDATYGGQQGAYQGDGVYSLDGSQAATSLTVPNLTSSFDIKIKSDASDTRPLKVKLPAFPTGWNAVLRDALQNGTDITLVAQSVDGWTSPALAPGATKELRLELTPSLGAIVDASVLVRVENQSGSRADVVQAKATLQSAQGMEYTLDPGADGAGTDWQPVPANGLDVTQWSVVGLRAIRRNPGAPWPSEPFKPVWTRGEDSFVGETVWLHFPVPTATGSSGEDVQLECGNTLSTKVRVIAEAE